MPSAPPPRPRGWWQRHWKWAVPLIALIVLSLVFAFVYGLTTVIGGAVRDNDAYRIAMAQAAADPDLVAAIGSPIEHDGFMSANMSRGVRSTASLRIPVSGPRGEATVFVEAEEIVGVWRFSLLSVTVDGADTPIDLLPSLPDTRRMSDEQIEAHEALEEHNALEDHKAAERADADEDFVP